MQTRQSHKRKSDGDSTDSFDKKKDTKIRTKKSKLSLVEECGTPQRSRSRTAPSDDADSDERMHARNSSSNSSSSSSSTLASSSASTVDTMQEEKDVAVDDTSSAQDANDASAGELDAADANVADAEAATESNTEAEISTSDQVVADGEEDSKAEKKAPVVVVKELVKLPTCPVCFEELVGKIVQCKTGHYICEECYQKLTWQHIHVGAKHLVGRICPICKSETYHCTGDNIAQRNFGLEELIATLESECKHGCGLICKGKERTEHLLECHLRPVSCLAGSCDQKMTTDKLVAHMHDVHKSRFRTHEQVASQWLASRLFEKDAKSIFIVVKLTENSHYAIVLTPAAHGERKLGFVDLNPNPHKALHFHFALSVGEDENSEPQEHMLITGDMLKIYSGVQRLSDPYIRDRVHVPSYMVAMCKANPHATRIVFTVNEEDAT